MLAQHLDDLSGESSEYNGPNLRDELWTLGSRVDFKITATAEVGPSASDKGPVSSTLRGHVGHDPADA
jgi:hypothetical protein